MRIRSPATLFEYISSFAKLYHEYRVQEECLRAVKYRIASTLEEYRKTHTIQLAITDHPGDLLPPLGVDKIKDMPDLIAGMHPIDVNSINDLYYLPKDNVVELKVDNDRIVAIDRAGDEVVYDLAQKVNPEHLNSRRLAYMLGYMQAERITRDAYNCRESFEVVRDNISTLHVKHLQSGKMLLKKPTDILFSEEYENYSKKDIARIGYICGQLSGTH